jgi:hypothetical protein
MTPAVADDERLVPCPRCTAGVGEPCQTPAGVDAKGPHAKRVKAAERERERQRQRAAQELPDERIGEHRWRRVYLSCRGELEQRGAWTRLAAEQVEAMVRNMAQADKCRAAAEAHPTVPGSTGNTVANPLGKVAIGLDAQALMTARELKLTPNTRGTSATVEDDADADPDTPPEEVDELAGLDDLARHKIKRAQRR